MHAPLTLEGSTLTLVDAYALQPNDRMANLGIVESVSTVGAFLVVEYTARQWNLGTGRTTYSRRQVTLHLADTVAVAR